MSPDAHVGSAARRWEIALACAAAALVLAAVAVAAIVAVPPTVANLSSEVSDGREPTDLGDASVVVPADWVVTRDSEHAITVRTPDGALRAEVESVDESPADVVARAAAGTPRSELLASGLTALHVDLDDGGVVAGVGEPDAAPSVRVVVEVRPPEGGEPAAYRSAIGDLLEGVRR
ncbi:hypothetical protein [Microbacterium ureisolvens]|uniref:Uncharacterized protein n=1 Tax=Microbacterium ureisolvens TaxID=2781186 RepID=A0ABS7HYT8_9MICO|nr:hypothetical protein [Microbacterium ureisolvens]MBW9110559.1 hypothetical protein [Microbacterium ureisolvens]